MNVWQVIHFKGVSCYFPHGSLLCLCVILFFSARVNLLYSCRVCIDMPVFAVDAKQHSFLIFGNYQVVLHNGQSGVKLPFEDVEWPLGAC